MKDKPHYTLPAAALADWIENQPDKWWSVDGDPILSATLDFPCPVDEIAPMIRRIGKPLLVQAKGSASTAHGELIGRDKLDELTELSRRRQKILCLSWQGADVDWLLLEDDAMVPT